MRQQVVIEVWGDFACFTRPEAKVERLSYPVPTPSAMRGVLSAIYSKPKEFYWQINQIEVLNPIKFISFKRNEVKKKTNGQNPIQVEDNDVRTQRQSVILQDVHYRIHAAIVRNDACKHSLDELYKQAFRRIQNGKCFFQPSLGCREFVAYFEESDGVKKPIDYTQDLGLMLYDVFDLHKTDPILKEKPFISMFNAKLEKGVLVVPDFDSEAVLKQGGTDA
ncbi:MAG: type I-C CRISPR-associated protein Cas5 [Clostridiaceae bacterium]|jgi:CRISPR-associated protein Cas5d|nr:type I-C CRISPR-associated protein Cas5 [Clostridiaceae bacterium]